MTIPEAPALGAGVETFLGSLAGSNAAAESMDLSQRRAAARDLRLP